MSSSTAGDPAAQGRWPASSTHSSSRSTAIGSTGSAALRSTARNAPSSSTPAAATSTVGAEPDAHLVPPRLAASTIELKAAKQPGAQVVDRRARPHARGRQGRRDHGQRDEADRQVDVEDRPPRKVLDDHSAEQRPGDARDSEHRSEQPLIATAFARGHDVAHRRLHSTIRPPAPSPCTARNAISSVIDRASPHSADPTRNSTTALCRTRFRPS